MKVLHSIKIHKVSLACIAAVSSLLASGAHAGTIYAWNTAANGNWTDTGAWTPTAPATGPVAGDTATFNAAGVNGTETIFLNGNESADSVIFNNTSPTTVLGGTSSTPAAQSLILSSPTGAGLTVNSGAGAVTLGNATTTNVIIQLNGSQTLLNNSSALLSIGTGTTSQNVRGATGATGTNVLTLDGSGNGIIFGTIQDVVGKTALTKNGAGAWELDGSNSMTGDVTLNSGQLNIKSSNALGTAAKTININGGSLGSVSAARSLPAALSIVVGGDFSFGDSATSLGTTIQGTVNLGSAIRGINTVGNGTITGVVSGAGGGGITKTGGATLTFGAATNYTGATTISGGTIGASTTNALSASSAFLVASGGTLNMAGFSQTIASLSDSGGSGGHVILGGVGAGTLTAGGDNSTTIFSGVIGGAGTGGGLTKTGSGMMTLQGANTYLGTTKVNGGTLALNKTGGALLDTSGLALSGGAVLLDASNQIVDTATVSFGGGTLNTGGNSETVGAATLTASSVIDMGSGSSVLAFANSSASTWTGSNNLDIYDWSGTPGTGGGTDQLFFGADGTGLTSAQLADIRFFSDAGTTQFAGATTILGNGEVVPAAVPEPTSLSLLLVGAGLLSRRRKSR